MDPWILGKNGGFYRFSTGLGSFPLFLLKEEKRFFLPQPTRSTHYLCYNWAFLARNRNSCGTPLLLLFLVFQGFPHFLCIYQEFFPGGGFLGFGQRIHSLSANTLYMDSGKRGKLLVINEETIGFSTFLV